MADFTRDQHDISPTYAAVVSDSGQFEGNRKMGLYYSVDNYIINTPPDQVYKNIGEVLFNSVGYGAGVSYDAKIGAGVEVGVGLEYAQISYAPQQINEVFLDPETGGVYSIFLEMIKYRMVSIPLSMKFKLVGNQNWSIYTQMGLSTNIVATSDYTTDVSARVKPVHAPPAHFDIEQNNENGPRLFEKAFSEGFAEGGHIEDNVYFTANLGLGFSKNVAERISLFSLLNYKSNVFDFGIGPNNDKLATLSFTAGLQYALN